MIKKIFNFISFLVISSLVLSIPLSVLAQDAGMTMPSSGGTSGSFQQPMQQPMMDSGQYQQPMNNFQQQPMMSGDQFGGQQMMGSQQFQQPMNNFQQQPMMNNNQQFQQPGTNFGQDSAATCKVNGVDMPGGCDKWNQSSGMGGDQGQMGGQNNQWGNQQGGQGMMGPGGQGQGMQGGQGQFGPSDEEMEKMEKMREAQENKMRAKGLQQAKKGMTQFLKALKMVQTKMAKMEKQGVVIPSDLKNKIETAIATLESIINAKEWSDEIEEKMMSMQEIGEEMQNIMPRLEMLSRLPQMLKKAKSEISRLEKSYASAVKKAARAKVDVSSILGQWQAAIEELKNNLAAAASGQLGEDGEDPMQAIGEGVFENLESAWRFDQIIRMVLDVKRNLRNVEAMLKKYEKQIARLEKKGEDMTEAKEVLAMMKEKYAEVKDIAWDKLEPEEIEDFMSGLEGYMEMQQQMEEMLDFGGPSMFEKEMKRAPSKEDKMPGLNMPDFGQLMKANEDAQNKFVQQWSVAEEKLLAQFNADKVAKLKRLAALLRAAKKEVAALGDVGMEVPSDLLAALGFSSASNLAMK